MRHGVAGRHLGRNTAQRKALFRNLVRELYLHERIITTEAKARSIRADAEKLITKAKHGVSSDAYRVHAQRQVVAYLNDKTVAKKVFDEFATICGPQWRLHPHDQDWQAPGRRRRHGRVGVGGPACCLGRRKLGQA
jgi:large subunit ribosomal protein L17